MLAVRLITAAGVANQRRLTVDQRNGEGGGGVGGTGGRGDAEGRGGGGGCGGTGQGRW